MRIAAYVIASLLVLLATVRSSADQIFSQPPNPAGGQFKSAWYPPDGLDGDMYCYDNFTLSSAAAINEIRWRGAYTNYLSGAGRAPVIEFTISIYRSGAGGFQPDLGTDGRLVRFYTGGNAGETAIGTVGGVIMYDYAFVLDAPFQAAADTKYWLLIEASQGLTPTYYWPPDWSIAAGTGGNNSHFRKTTGGPYQTIGGDHAFNLYSSSAPSVTITTGVLPLGAGTISGGGSYPVNSTVALIASPNPGWGFVNWTEGGSEVSNNPRYNFPATVNRSITANFVPAYTITATPVPAYGGTVSGAGIYNSGSTVELVATPNQGFIFSGWSDGSTAPVYSFPAQSNRTLFAYFETAPLSAMFNFDDAPAYTTLPISLSSNGISASVTSSSSSGGTFAIWPYDTWGIRPAGFSGLSLFPTTVFGADLIADFSHTLVDFSILYCPQELGCDDSARMRVSVYMNGVFVATNTATCPIPGSYPSGTLSITAPAGFNRAVVHYDAPPPTCQDYGIIFFADNMVVTRAATCAPDFNGDGTVDFFDYLDFVDAFSSTLPAADFNQDSVIDFFDYLDFVDAFSIGC